MMEDSKDIIAIKKFNIKFLNQMKKDGVVSNSKEAIDTIPWLCFTRGQILKSEIEVNAKERSL